MNNIESIWCNADIQYKVEYFCGDNLIERIYVYKRNKGKRKWEKAYDFDGCVVGWRRLTFEDRSTIMLNTYRELIPCFDDLVIECRAKFIKELEKLINAKPIKIHPVLF